MTMAANHIQSRVDVDEIRNHLDYIDPRATADFFAADFGVRRNTVYTYLRRHGHEDLRERLHRNRARVAPFGFNGKGQVAA